MCHFTSEAVLYWHTHLASLILIYFFLCNSNISNTNEVLEVILKSSSEPPGNQSCSMLFCLSLIRKQKGNLVPFEKKTKSFLPQRVCVCVMWCPGEAPVPAPEPRVFTFYRPPLARSRPPVRSSPCGLAALPHSCIPRQTICTLLTKLLSSRVSLYSLATSRTRHRVEEVKVSTLFKVQWTNISELLTQDHHFII